jgi:hypothetical protein
LFGGLFSDRAFRPFDLTPGQVFGTDDLRARETRPTAESPRPLAIWGCRHNARYRHH